MEWILFYFQAFIINIWTLQKTHIYSFSHFEFLKFIKPFEEFNIAFNEEIKFSTLKMVHFVKMLLCVFPYSVFIIVIFLCNLLIWK